MLSYLLFTMVGIFLGAIGSGGSIFLIPILIFYFHYSPDQAIGIAYCIIAFITFFSCIKNRHYFHWQHQLFYFIIPAVSTTSILNFYLLPTISTIFVGFPLESVLLIMMAIFMIFSTIAIWYQPKPNRQKHNEFLIILAAIFYGLIVGFLGTGGGFLLVSIFIILMHMSFDEAAAASLVFIFITSYIGIFSHHFGRILLSTHFIFHAFLNALIGLWIGQKIQEIVPEKFLKICFAILMFSTAIFILIQEFFAIKVLGLIWI